MSEHAVIVDRRRDEFPMLADGIYLLAHSLGPMPRSARAAMQQYLDEWEGHTKCDAWESAWWGLSEELGDSIGGLITAPKGSVLPTGNATLAMATVASCFEYSDKRPNVVTTALDFPSMGYLWRAQERLGAQIVQVPSEDGITVDEQRVVDAIDERTALVAVSHTSYRSSFRIDPAPIIARAHEVGAMVCLDAYQSAGAVEIDAAGWEVDFMIGGSIKWLLGGPSCGWLYVRPELYGSLEPRLTGWFGHDNPFEFSHDAVRYAQGIRRFANGTASIPGLYSFKAGVELVAQVDVESIAAESRRRTQGIIDSAQDMSWPVRSPLDANRRGGTVMLGFEQPHAVASALREKGVFVDWRPGVGIRLSLHFYNTDEEVEAALEQIRSCV